MKMLTRIYKEDKDALKEYLMSRTQDLSTDVLVTVSNIIQDVKENVSTHLTTLGIFQASSRGILVH